MVNIDINNMPEPKTRLEAYLQLILKSLKNISFTEDEPDTLTLKAGYDWQSDEQYNVIKHSDGFRAYSYYGNEKVDSIPNGLALQKGYDYTIYTNDPKVCVQFLIARKSTQKVLSTSDWKKSPEKHTYRPSFDDELIFFNFKLLQDADLSADNNGVTIDPVGMATISNAFYWYFDKIETSEEAGE